MSVRGTRAPRCLLSSEIQKPSEAPRASAASTGATRETARPKIAAAEKIVTSHRTIRMGLGPDASNASSGHSLGGLIVFRSRVAGPNVVSIHEEGGTAGRPTGLCFLWLKVTHQKTHIEKSKSHKRKKKVRTHVRYPIKDSARGAQCAARRSPTKKTPIAEAQAARASGGKGGTSGRGSNGVGGVIRTS